MIKTIKKYLLSGILISATTLIASCGGGGSSTDPLNASTGAPSAADLAQNPVIVPGDTPAAVDENGEPLAGAALAFTAHVSPDDTAAHRFLTRATFGPKLDTIEELKGQTPAEWIANQMALPPTYMSERLAKESFRWGQYVNVWWKNTIEAEDQLRQRIAFALSQIFVISAKDSLGDEQPGVANYYDMLVKHAFGNFRDLMEEVTLSPIMGEYLSMKGNRKPDPENNIRPDENYAREILQLFTIGLSQLNDDGSVKTDADGIPLPTYDQDTVEAFAHIFTGWHFANVDDFRWATTTDYINPMMPHEEFHDKGPKTLLNGFEVPAGQSAREDLTMALDNIFNHPNVGPFISKQLIQRFVTSNPSPQYVSDITAVFNDNGVGVRGSIGSVMSAILLHEEAFNGHDLYPQTFGKLKEPVLRVSSLWRAFTPDVIHFDFNYAWAANEIAQAPLNANSVFNFYTPFFSQPGAIRNNALVSPEFEIHDETSIINVTNRLLSNSLWSHNQKYESTERQIAISIDREMPIGDDPDALIPHLDRVLLGGTMSEGLKEEVRTLIDARDYGWATSQKIVEAIFLIISSPEAAIQL